MNQFKEEVLKGLMHNPKQIPSKYFYDANGDEIFQKIMDLPEYYLTRTEMEIISGQKEKIIDKLNSSLSYDIVELGAGDGSKSIHLLESLQQRQKSLNYYPIDISSNVLSILEKKLKHKMPDLQIHGLTGDYFDMLQEVNLLSKQPKLVLFLGSSIGNFQKEEALHFLKTIHKFLNEGDYFFIGFDLKKDPKLILDAYNDKGGVTSSFNFNLLNRINKQLNGDFNLANFKHVPIYNPENGICQSQLVSTKHQKVTIGAEEIQFEEFEPICVEVSIKYTLEEIDNFALKCGFEIIENFYDSRKWFVDALWKVNEQSSMYLK